MEQKMEKMETGVCVGCLARNAGLNPSSSTYHVLFLHSQPTKGKKKVQRKGILRSASCSARFIDLEIQEAWLFN